MSVLGGVGKTLSNVTDKAAKAGQIKSVKLKIKMKPPKSATPSAK